MQQLLNSNLYIGSKLDFESLENRTNRSFSSEKGLWVYVHACKSYFDKLSPELKKNQRVVEFNKELYLDWLDLPEPDSFKVHDFIQVMDFIDKEIKDNKVLIHCDWGQSRSATLAMVYLSKKLKLLPNEFLEALSAFKNIYPDYQLPSGISKFVGQSWNVLE